jgi:hypothetical protein
MKTIADLKVGTKLVDVRFNDEFYITSITEKRINCDRNVKSYSSTGRGSSKFFVGVSRFNENLENGNYKIIN